MGELVAHSRLPPGRMGAAPVVLLPPAVVTAPGDPSPPEGSRREGFDERMAAS